MDIIKIHYMEFSNVNSKIKPIHHMKPFYSEIKR